MSAILLALAALGAGAPVARSELAITVDAAHAEILPAGKTAATSANDASITAELTLYPGGVRDDPTPRALQPFLQRASRFTVGATFGYLDAPNLPGGDFTASEREARTAVSTELFFHPSISVTAATGFRLADGAPSVHRFTIPIRLGVAAWLGPLRIEIAYDGAYLRNDAPPVSDRLASRVAMDLRAVLVNHIDLSLGALAGESRVDAWFQAAWYPTRNLGLTAGGFGGGHGATLTPSSASPRDLSAAAPYELPGAAHLGARIGFSYWPTLALGLAAHYTATWLSGDTAGATDSRFLVTVLGRAP